MVTEPEKFNLPTVKSVLSVTETNSIQNYLLDSAALVREGCPVPDSRVGIIGRNCQKHSVLLLYLETRLGLFLRKVLEFMFKALNSSIFSPHTWRLSEHCQNSIPSKLILVFKLILC